MQRRFLAYHRQSQTTASHIRKNNVHKNNVYKIRPNIGVLETPAFKNNNVITESNGVIGMYSYRHTNKKNNNTEFVDTFTLSNVIEDAVAVVHNKHTINTIKKLLDD